MRDGCRVVGRWTLVSCFVFLLVFFSTGCGTAPEVTSYVNPVSGRRTDTLNQNLIDAPGNDREMLWLNAYRDYSDRYHYKYYLEVIYGAREEAGYLEIGPGRSLKIIADNQEMNFTGLGSLSKDQSKGALFETARYEAAGDDIHRIASAQKVTVQLRGRHGVVTREFAPENSEKFRKFVQQTDDENL